MLIQYGNILGAQENIRAQQQVGRLTIIISILTLFIVMLTFAAVWLADENGKHLTAAINWVSGFMRR